MVASLCQEQGIGSLAWAAVCVFPAGDALLPSMVMPAAGCFACKFCSHKQRYIRGTWSKEPARRWQQDFLYAKSSQKFSALMSMACLDKLAPLQYGMTLTFQVEGDCSLMQCH